MPNGLIVCKLSLKLLIQYVEDNGFNSGLSSAKFHSL